MPNWCVNDLEVSGPEADVERFIDAIRSDDPNQDLQILASVVPMPAELIGTTSPGDTPNWYDWQAENWGVKWGDCRTRLIDTGPDGVALTFETPWGPPQDGLLAVSAAYPTLVFRNAYEEAGMQFFGRNVFRAGECTASMQGSVTADYDVDDDALGEDADWLYESGMLRGG